MWQELKMKISGASKVNQPTRRNKPLNKQSCRNWCKQTRLRCPSVVSTLSLFFWLSFVIFCLRWEYESVELATIKHQCASISFQYVMSVFSLSLWISSGIMISANKKIPMQPTRALLRHSINLAKEVPALEVTMLIPFNRCILMNRLVHHIFFFSRCICYDCEWCRRYTNEKHAVRFAIALSLFRFVGWPWRWDQWFAVTYTTINVPSIHFSFWIMTNNWSARPLFSDQCFIQSNCFVQWILKWIYEIWRHRYLMYKCVTKSINIDFNWGFEVINHMFGRCSVWSRLFSIVFYRKIRERIRT